MPISLHNWYSASDLSALGERKARLTGEIALSQLTRLRELLFTYSGSVKASIAFSQQGDDCVTLDLDYKVALELVCQRCLEPFAQEICEHTSVALELSSPSWSVRDNDCELLVLSGDRFSPSALIEDELIVSVPLAPVHFPEDRCGSLIKRLKSSVDCVTTQPQTLLIEENNQE